MRLTARKLVVLLALTTGAVLLGVVGVSLAVSDHGTHLGQSAQGPVGKLSGSQDPDFPGANSGGDNKDGSDSGGVNKDGSDSGGVKHESDSGSKPADGAGSAPGSGSSAAKASSSSGSGAKAGRSLPFTGFVVIPVLLAGLALLGAGLVLRRRDAASSHS